MIKTYTRMMYPEPADNGGGAEPAPAAPVEDKQNTETKTEQTNPFDFSQFVPEDGGEPAATEEHPAEEPEYALSFTAEDGLEADDVAFFTEKAKEYGLPADGATQFVRAMGKMLSEREEAQSAAAEKALQQEWGKEFDAKRKQVGAYMGRVFASMKLTREQMMEFATPAHFRVFHHLMKQSSEKAAVTAPAALTPEQQSVRLQELNRQLVQHKYSNNNEGADKVTAEINRISMQKFGCKIYN